jgi:hypothetical protein
MFHHFAIATVIDGLAVFCYWESPVMIHVRPKSVWPTHGEGYFTINQS